MHETRVGMKPEVVYTKAAPKTGFSEGMESPIAQGVKCGQFLFVSGQGPLDPVTKDVLSQDLAEQTRVTLENMRAVLEAGGTSIEHVVKVVHEGMTVPEMLQSLLRRDPKHERDADV